MNIVPYMEVPEISSFSEYSHLYKGATSKVPMTLEGRVDHLEREMEALKEANEALRQYIMSLNLPVGPGGLPGRPGEASDVGEVSAVGDNVPPANNKAPRPSDEATLASDETPRPSEEAPLASDEAC